ncbi:MAG: phosphatidylglycerophosphatase A [Acidobacteriota bacterium]|nr:MAG: phosphatidylglycerophosphatase A [Acidobacteriota bacterium]
MGISGSLGKKQVELKARSKAALASAQFISTGFGLGYLPLAPGTWASAAAAVFWYAVYQLPIPHLFIFHLVAVGLLIPIAWISGSVFSDHLRSKDPSIIVIDEILGQSFCYLFIPLNAAYFIAGFLLFRLFDIVKPPPARQAERLQSGLGIMLDDLVAGFYAGALIWLFHAS